jgi:hypothetical protein
VAHPKTKRPSTRRELFECLLDVRLDIRTLLNSVSPPRCFIHMIQQDRPSILPSTTVGFVERVWPDADLASIFEGEVEQRERRKTMVARSEVAGASWATVLRGSRKAVLDVYPSLSMVQSR